MADALWVLDRVELAGRPSARIVSASLSIGTGTTAVLGPSGSGKTSLLNLLVGFESPTAGSLHGPESLFWCPADAGLWPWLDVEDHLRVVQPGPDATAEDLLRQFDLVECRSLRPELLSHGQRQRVSLARALATQARALVLDEPLTHVDVTARRRYWRVLRSHIAEHGTAIVFATHDPSAVLAEADSVICLDEGKVVFAGPVHELRDRPGDAKTARFLGDVNCLSRDDARHWLGTGEGGLSDNGELLCRPERIDVVADDSSPFVVVDSRDHGPTGEVELFDETTGATRSFLHRASRQPLRPGLHVRVRLLLCLFALLLVACGADDGPRLVPRAVHVHVLPQCDHKLPAPRGVAVGRDGRWLILDTAGRVLVLSHDGKCERSWSMPDVALGKPEGICQLADGRIVVADTHYHRVVFFDDHGKVLSTLGSRGDGRGKFRFPIAVIQDEAGFIYVAEYGGNDRVQKFGSDGCFVTSFGKFGTRPGEFQRPSGLVASHGRIYVSDAMNSRVHVFESDGKFVGLLEGDGPAPELVFPYDLAQAPDGTLWVVEYGAGRLTQLSLTGRVLARFGRPGRGTHELSTPWGLAISSDGRVLLADTGNRRLVEVTL